MIDILLVAAWPNDGGPGDYRGSMSLAAATLRAQSSALPTSAGGRCWSGIIKETPYDYGGIADETAKTPTAHAGRGLQPVRRCSACPWGACSSRERHWEMQSVVNKFDAPGMSGGSRH